MRHRTPPTGSSSVESDRPTGESVSPSVHSPGLVTPTATTSLSEMSAPATDEGSQPADTNFWESPAHAQTQLHTSIEGADGVGEMETIDEEFFDHEMADADAEDGGAPLGQDFDVDVSVPITHNPEPVEAELPPDNVWWEEADDLVPNSPPAAEPFLPTPPVLPLAFEPFLLIPELPPPPPAPEWPENDLVAPGNNGPNPPHAVPDILLNPNIMINPNILLAPNPGVLMPDNHNSAQFLRLWQFMKRLRYLRDVDGIPFKEDTIMNVKQRRVVYADLNGDMCDPQGIDWNLMGIDRNSARRCRLSTLRAWNNVSKSHVYAEGFPDVLSSRHENFFKFRSMDLRNDVRLLHFQLRNILGCASRTSVFYPCSASTITELDPTTGNTKTAMRFDNERDASVTTLTAEGGFLVAGGFHGNYRYRRLETQDPSRCYDGRLTDHPSGITNHVQICSSRGSSVPLAAFASNDYGFRIVDLNRNEIISDKMYGHALNCTALSPDKRLRVMVGDQREVMITNAETGECLQRLEGHRDYGFACAWAPDGWTVATGNQDKSIRIWDARKWKNAKGESLSVSVIRAETAGIRSLRFSPLGSGKRILLAAEEADMLNMINAQTFTSKQTFDIFGELVGASFASAGQEIISLISDPYRGGVLCLERCDYGAEDTFDYNAQPDPQNPWRSSAYDWLPTPQDIVEHPDSQFSLTQKRRQAAMAEDWFF